MPGANKLLAAGRSGQRSGKVLTYGEVVDIILDDSHESYDPDQALSVGCCRVRLLPEDQGKSPEECNWYQPHSVSDVELPLIGELVTLIQTGTQGVALRNDSTNYYWHKPISLYQESHNNNIALATSTAKGTELVPPLGFYTPEITSFPMGLLEGDKILLGRYGQAIRFTTAPGNSPLNPWWKNGATGDPVLSLSVGNDVSSESSIEDLESGAHIVLSDGVLIKDTTTSHSDPHILLKSSKITIHSDEWKADWTALLDVVKDLVAEVEVISKGTFPTGVGPTGPHPTSVGKMAQIKQALAKLEA